MPRGRVERWAGNSLGALGTPVETKAGDAHLRRGNRGRRQRTVAEFAVRSGGRTICWERHAAGGRNGGRSRRPGPPRAARPVPRLRFDPHGRLDPAVGLTLREQRRRRAGRGRNSGRQAREKRDLQRGGEAAAFEAHLPSRVRPSFDFSPRDRGRLFDSQKSFLLFDDR